MLGIVILIILLALALEFAITSFVVWIGSLIFPYEFSWLLSIFITFVIAILQSIFKHNND